MQEECAQVSEEASELRKRLTETESAMQRMQRLDDRRSGDIQRRMTEQEVGLVSA